MNRQRVILFAAITVLMTPTALAGRLQIGAPVFQGELITVPVYLDGDVGVGVAALDFRLNYDPYLLEPLAALPGAAATAANKNVAANMKTPGEYIVVMMGMNQTTVTSGEVVNIVLEKLAEPESGRSQLQITRTTLVAPDAAAIPSRGSSRQFRFYADVEPEMDAEQSSSDDARDEPARSEGPAEDSTPASDMPRARSGATSVPPQVPAGSEAEPTEIGGDPSRRGVFGTAIEPVSGGPSEEGEAAAQRLMAAVREADRLRATITRPAADAAPREQSETAKSLPRGDAPPGEKAVSSSTTLEGERTEQALTLAKVSTADKARQAAEEAAVVPSPPAPAATPTGAQRNGGLIAKLVLMAVIVAAVLGLFAVRKRLFT